MMRNQFGTTIVVSILVSSAICQELAPPSATPRVVVTNGAERILNVVELEKQSLKLERQAAGYSWDPKAEALLNTAKKATASALHLDLKRVLHRSIRRTDEDGDVMTIMWDISSASMKGTLCLEDSPSVSQYVLSLHETSIERLAAVLPEILIWPDPISAPLIIQRIEQHESMIGQINVRFTGAAKPRIHDYDIRGTGTGDGHWIIEIVIGKGKLSKYYGDTFGVAERVPPLSETVKSWSDGKLIAELSNRTDLNARDNIIMAEVVRRGPSRAYLMELVSKVAMNPMTQLTRFDQIILALNGSDPSGTKARAFVEENIPSLEALGRSSEEIVHTAYRIVGCSESTEQRAIRYLTESRFLNAAFAYFSRCSTSSEAYGALEAARFPEQLDSRRQDALRAFRARIEGQTPAQRPSSIK